MKILDFGLAKQQAKTGTHADATLTQEAQQLSTPGAAMGTLAYMSPEPACSASFSKQKWTSWRAAGGNLMNDELRRRSFSIIPVVRLCWAG